MLARRTEPIVRELRDWNDKNIRNVETVFRRGLGYDAAKLKESIKGTVGLR